MLFALLGLCFLLVNANTEYPEALKKCLTYDAVSEWYIAFNRMLNRNLDWNNKLSYEACYDLVGLEKNNVNERYESGRSFAGRSLALKTKVRMALSAGSQTMKEKVRSLVPSTEYGCNGLLEGDYLKVLCLYQS
uniref:SCP domain-containing protein n=1 Tax=Biomphalaria glabrata TaxID=6526 RepID=A0A2C9LQM7_BIOGL